MVKLIIFDWGRTLYDSDNQVLFPGTRRVLDVLTYRKYRLAIVSLASDGDFGKRRELLQTTRLESYFSLIQFSQTNKDLLYAQTITELAFKANEVAIVDDRIIRGIQWGNRHGSTTVWLRKGKFAHQGPNTITGQPTYVIDNIEDLCHLAL